jgi:formyl-CoA transferase/CoA:oxalate CoA-transferase
VLRRLLARADVFVQSLRSGAVAGLGLDFAGAVTLNPRLVYCSITAFGTRGPLRDLPGYDPMMQAYAGLMSVNGHPGQEPARVGTSIVDMGTGMWAALGIVAGVRQRETTGRAVEVTTALFDTTLMWVCYHAMGYLGSGEVPTPQGSGTAMIAPYQAFPAVDGHVMIAAGSDTIFARLTQALGAPALAADDRFRDNPGRVRHRAALATALAALTRERKVAELVAELRRHGVPAAPVLGIDAVLAEPQTRESGALVTAPHPRLGELTGVGLPIQWDGRRPGMRRVPPRLGEHSEDILTWLGYTRDDVRGLRARRVIT